MNLERLDFSILQNFFFYKEGINEGGKKRVRKMPSKFIKTRSKNGHVKTKISQINYFELDKSQQHFVRVYAPLVSLTKHRLIVKIDGQIYYYESVYDLTKLKIDTLLLAFVYKNDSKKTGRLYPLPRDGKFKAEDAVEKYPTLTQKEQFNLIFTVPELKSKLIKFNELKTQVKRLWEISQNYNQSQVNFASSIQMPISMLNSGVNVESQNMKGNCNGTSGYGTKYLPDGRRTRSNTEKKVINLLSKKEKKQMDKKMKELFSGK